MSVIATATLVLCGTVTTAAAPQDPANAPRSPLPRTAVAGLDLRDIPGRIAALEAIANDVADTPDADLWRDMLATYLTFVHDTPRAIALDSAAYRTTTGNSIGGGSVADLEARDAVAEILERARDRQVVMFNEEHRRSRQRAFAHELLQPLAEAGFTHLALETMTRDEAAMDALNERGYPLTTDGWYTQDPLLGDLVRRALALGLTVENYEADRSKCPPEVSADPMRSTNWREEQQAKNLAAILAENPNARILVWCGRHHLSESVSDDPATDWTPMGGLFGELTGIDPLTVDLMVMTEGDPHDVERAVYREAADAGRLERPTVFVDADGKPYSAIEDIDLMVFFPRTTWVDGRPAWLTRTTRRLVAVDVDGLDLAPTDDTPLCIEARLAGEDERSVPFDRYLWRREAPPAAALRPGHTYELRIQNLKGETLHTLERTVE